MDWRLASAFEGLAWPAVPGPESAAVLALLWQLERSQWLAREELERRQLAQLGALLRHAYETVPYYRRRWGALYHPSHPPSFGRFAQLPLLTRHDLQGSFEALKSLHAALEHGTPQERRTSGSTGTPVRILDTPHVQQQWRAQTLRDHLWHRRDLSRKLAVIRVESVVEEAGNWGPATAGLAATGPVVQRTVGTDVAQLLQWLENERPDYLFTYPSLAAELARLSLRDGIRLPALRELRTLGEAVDPELRALCREAWGVPLVDLYSAGETGYIALQCPQHEHYHILSESVSVEILRDDGSACAVGETGRVVVTTLHNFAMPLVRYEIGDLAEVGEPCACGRGLPVLRRVMGRTRNTLVTADGKRYWPSFGVRGFSDIAPVLQHQFIQKAYDLIEVRLVTATPLSEAQEAGLRRHILSRIPAGFRLALVRCGEIPRGSGGKYEDFVSEVAVR
jgi:phenylacetate-CoA ligase